MLEIYLFSTCHESHDWTLDVSVYKIDIFRVIYLVISSNMFFFFFLIKENLSNELPHRIFWKLVLILKSKNDQFQPSFSEMAQFIN